MTIKSLIEIYGLEVISAISVSKIEYASEIAEKFNVPESVVLEVVAYTYLKQTEKYKRKTVYTYANPNHGKKKKKIKPSSDVDKYKENKAATIDQMQLLLEKFGK